jgi:DNA-binding CsgD family transcriptional regulator
MCAAQGIGEGNSFERSSDSVPQLWSDLSVPLLKLLRAQQVCVVEHDFECNRGDIRYSTGLNADLCERYRSGLSTQNVWLQALRYSEPEETHVGAELVPNWELVGTSFYRRWLRPQNVLHALIGVISRSREGIRCLFALREASYAPFASSDKKLLKPFLPELRSALEAVAEIASLHQLTTMLLDLIEELSDFAVIVDEAARPILLNGAVTEFLARSDSLTLMNDVLVSNSPRDTCRLHAAISAVVRRADGRLSGESVVIGREASDAPIVLHVVRLPHPAVNAAGRAAPLAAVFIPPVTRSETLEGCLHFYRLTPAEKRLAAMIVGGWPLLEAARQLQITQNTARTHMKRIYAKTETHRQADLVRLLMTTSVGLQ